MEELKPCPCGKIPEFLCISKTGSSKWGQATGNCCGEWNIEFRTKYYALDSNECIELAIKYWNDAPRAG